MRSPAAACLALSSLFVLSAAAADEPRVVLRGAQVVGEAVVPQRGEVELRDLPVVRAWQPGDPIKEVPRRRRPVPEGKIEAPVPDALVELARQPQRGAGPPVSVLVNVNGQGFTGVNPPDTVGDVGPDEFVQSINGGGGALVTVHDKTTGAVIFGPVAMDTLGSGGSCASGLGDPIVLYDEAADRWLLSEFASGGNHLCVYISQTNDPAGAYFRYDFTTPNFPDYPKYAVWPDAYYVSTNENSPAVYALDRQQMLAGNAATMQRFTGPDLAGFGFQAFTPADHDGAQQPPAGAPGIFMRHRDTEPHGPGGMPSNDLLEIWAFDVDFVTPANSTFTQLPDISTAEFDSTLCGLTSFFCMGMPGVAQGSGSSLDPLREVIMNRLAYRNFGSHEALVGNLVTDIGADHGGVRWFELRRSGGNWALHQEGTWTPNTTNRWMAGSAMNADGGILLGYNVSDGAVFPGLSFTGRVAGDPAGTMSIPETVLVAGSAANGSNRYGDYSSMSIDPVDGCTFWFTGEYNPASQWSTRIGAIRIDACGTPDFFLAADPPTQTICAGDTADIAVNVGQIAGFSNTVTLTRSGHPAGSTAVFDDNTITPPGTATLTIGNTGAVPANTYTITVDGTATGSGGHSATADLVVLTAVPGSATLTSPANGATGVPTAPTLTWTAAAGATGYLVEVDDDANFSSPEFSATVAGTSTGATGLAANVLYHWRVTADNACGDTVSTVFTFTTALEYCATPNLAIPDNGAAVTSTIVVPAGGSNLTDLDLFIRGNHTWVGDVIFGLSKDGGANQLHFDRPGVPGSTFGCSSNGPDITLDDESGVPVESACPTNDFVGTFSPNVPLSFFDGQSISGTWTLSADDNAGGDSGSLLEWCLLPTLEVDPMPFLDGFESGDTSQWSATQN